MLAVLSVAGFILKIILCILAALLFLVGLLAFSTAKLKFEHSLGPVFSVKLLGIKFNVTKFLSRRQKQKKTKIVRFTGESFGEFPHKPAKKKKRRKKADHKVGKTTIPKEKKSITEILELVTGILSEISKPLGKCAALRIKRLKITAASDSPDKTAILFGNLNTAAGMLILAAQEFSALTVDDGAVGIYSDFMPGNPRLDADIELSVRIRYVIAVAFKGLKSYLKNK